MDKYECINGVFMSKQIQMFTNLPVKGKVYTLKEEVVSAIDGKVGYVFEELPNPKHPNGQEYSFRPSRFRPTDKISIDNLIEERDEVVVL